MHTLFLHYFSNFSPIWVQLESKANYTQSYDLSNSTQDLFLSLFFIKKKKEFLSSKNAKHVKVNFVDDVLAIDLKKIEGR